MRKFSDVVLIVVVLLGAFAGGLQALDNGRTFLGPERSLVWVADAGHFVTSGASTEAVLPPEEAWRLVAEMNSGRVENFGHHDWRLASLAELQRLHQAYASGELATPIDNFGTFERWIQARTQSARTSATRGWTRVPVRIDNDVFAWPVRAAQLAPPGFSEVAVFAENSLVINRSTTVTGDVVANQALSGPALDPGFGVSLQRLAAVTGDVKGDKVVLNRDSKILDPTNPAMPGRVFYNQLTDFGASPTPVKVTPLALPVFSELPVFQPADVRVGAADVFVAAGATQALAPGSYRDVTIAEGGVLVLNGQYDFRSVAPVSTTGGQCPFPCRSIQFAGASDVRIQGRFDIGSDASVAPQAGSGVSAAQVIIYPGGSNGGDGSAAASPAAFAIGQGSTLRANVYAPNGTIWISQNSTVEGGLFARDVNVDRDSSVTRNSFYANRPPVADPQTVVTFGSPVVITLTGSDPEQQDLSFSIVSGPTVGMLSGAPVPIVPDPVTDPETNETSQPPIVSATVTYTPVDDPMAEGDFADSFTFAVTDPAGAMGMAVVDINPPGDPTTPPDPVAAVTAIDGSVETSVDVPVAFFLNADAPAETALTFSIQDPLPTGTLTDSDGFVVTSARDLPSSGLTFTPPSGASGTFVVSFGVRGVVDGVLQSASGTVTITVLAGVELAPDQQRVTAVNIPVLVTLFGNSGGSGQQVESAQGNFRLAARGNWGGPHKVILPPDAEIAGNVSDANGDGLGDGRDQLPGPAPVLIAAGVDVNLGATPSGSVTDPAGDATNSTSDDPANPDLVFASIGSDGTNLNLSIRFVAAGFSSATSRGSFVLDIDENPATGFPGVDAANNDSALMGVEFLVNVGANLGANAEVLKFISLPNNFSNVGSFAATVLSDGYDVSIPLSVFDNDDGRMTFKAETQSYLGSGFTGILDYAPNLGLAPGQSRAGVQGVARIQIEWDIPSLGVVSSDQVQSATVLLQTQKGTVDSLDTFFYAGTAEQDGLLSVSDFQAPAGLLTGVVMPVPRDAQTGDPGTFSFDVTNAFKAALDDPAVSFFSIQGRVNETFAGQGFKRGLQIRSTADGNIAADLEPTLSLLIADSQPAALVWTVTELPADGTLKDATGRLVTVGQVFLTQPTLLYTPNFAFEGTNTVRYTVGQGGLLDVGVVTLVVTSNGSCLDNEVFCDAGRN